MSVLPSLSSEALCEDINKCSPMTTGAVDNADISTSYRLQTSSCSTLSNDSELSSLSLCLDREMESFSVDVDELPAFEIRLISPLGRTPSPIDSDDTQTPTRPLPSDHHPSSLCLDNSDYIALHDINAQISPPTHSIDHIEDDSCLSRTNSLETIFEGVFLNTPPRQHCSNQNKRKCRQKFLEKIALNRQHSGKENKSPASDEESMTKCLPSLEFGLIKHSEYGH